MTEHLVDLKIAEPDNTAEAKARQALERAEAFKIESAADYEAAAVELAAIKSKWNEIEESRKALKKPVDEAAKRIQSFFKPPLDFLARAEAVIKRSMVTWSEKQEAIAREEQRKADERARKERERLEREANKAENAGRAERADILRDRAESIVPAVPPPATPKVSGISGRKSWKYEITDPDKLPRKYMVPDEKRIRRVVNAMQGDTDIPGVRVWQESTIAARGS